MRAVFAEADVILTPTTPCVAPLIGQERIVLDGVEVLARRSLGLYTQPISFIGLPALSVPVPRPGGLPVAVQLVGAPYGEAAILRVAAALEKAGVAAAPAALDPAS